MKNNLSKDMKNINWRKKRILAKYRDYYFKDLIKKDIETKDILKNDTIDIISELQKKIIKLLEENIQLNKLIVEINT